MLVPVIGSFVLDARDGQFGTVTAHQGDHLQVTWGDGRAARVARRHLRCGLQIGQMILEQPRSLRPSLGEGRVLDLRTLGGREQALVEFWEPSERHWLPWEGLLPIWSAQAMYQHGVTPPTGYAEKFRLRQLGRALQHWNQTTGALAQVDIDPLPHQLHLVHRILSSGNLNWLIADDVGLGKTIEVGLLLTALRQRGLRRFLLVTPAGLTRQWQAELRERFGITRAMVYGEDFEISDPDQWPLFEVVIGSMDRFKSERHLELLRQSGRWDMIVFDEAHRLSRSLYGLSYTTSERYHLAATLRAMSENVLLLSGTPHQGRIDKFEALLELLRPGAEWRARIAGLRLEPQLLSGLVIRNRKADVTDAQGNFIFKGKVTRSVAAPQGQEEADFDHALRRYLRQGYDASRQGGQASRAIGFVMTIYRKLAASSVAAIEKALIRRLARLRAQLEEEWAGREDAGAAPSARAAAGASEEEREDDLFIESEERVTGGRTEFFGGETELLEDLITLARGLRANDTKMMAFNQALVATILQGNPDEKVLIFTEYRSTQDYLVEALQALKPGKVDVINGGQNLEARAAAIAHFEEEGQFLVSTEAGGEGFNLQKKCHILVNYDLPWNPMRLVQRVGRLYRYGQEKPVVVFNLNTQGSLDDEILFGMYDRLEHVAADLAGVAEEYKDGLQEDIVGEIASFLDIADILAEASGHTPQRTQARIDDALERARQMAAQQNDFLRHSSGFDPSALKGELPIGEDHLVAFVEGMFAQLSVTVSSRLYSGRVWEIKLSEDLQQQLGMNQNQRIAFDRTLARAAKATLLDANSRLLAALFRAAAAYEFGGQIAAAALPGDQVMCGQLRWQDDRGLPLSERYMALVRDGGQIQVNPPAFSEWLLRPAEDQHVLAAPDSAAWSDFEQQMNALLSSGATDELHPSGHQVSGMGWNSGDERQNGP